MTQEEKLTSLEREFAHKAGKIFSKARHEAFKLGFSVVQSKDGVVYRVRPDGKRVQLKVISKPIPYQRGRTFEFSADPSK